MTAGINLSVAPSRYHCRRPKPVAVRVDISSVKMQHMIDTSLTLFFV